MTRAQAVLAILALILLALALLVLHPSGEPGVALRDFEAYYSAGMTWLAHGDPYSLAIWNAESRIPGVVASRYEALPFVGLPATLPFWSLFARLPYHGASILWTIAIVCAFFAIVLATARLLRLSLAHMQFAAILTLAFVPMTSDAVLGQAALPAYAFTVLAMCTPGAWPSIGVAMSALQPNVALGLLTLIFAKRGAVALAIGAVIVYVTGALAAGAFWPVAYLRVLSAHAGAERFAAIQYTPAAVLYGFGASQGAAQLLAGFIAVIAAGVAIYAVIAARTLPHRFAIVCCAIPFVAGFFHEHDFVALYVPAIFVLSYGRNPALAVIATVLIGVNWLDFAQQPQAIVQDVVLAVALLTAAIGFAPRRELLAAAAVSVVILAFGAWIGHMHPLPIWPNDMHGAAHGATIAEVWKNEQLQAGLLRPDTAAAMLRCFALVGAASLFYLTLNIDVHEVIERRNGVGMEVL